MKVNLSGEILTEEQANFSIYNRGYQYGDALFETIRVINTKIMFWEDHYFRLMASMRILRMEIPLGFSPEFLAEEIQHLIKINNLEDKALRVKINIHRKEGGLYLPEDREVGYLISLKPISDSFYLLKNEAYEVELYKDYFQTSGLLSTLKTNNRSLNVLASIFAEENAYDNCLLINEKKNIIEAVNGNIFVVKGNRIKTPPLAEGCIQGIIRKKLIEIINKAEEYTLDESPVSPFELQKSDEMFITNVIVGIQPITKYRKKTYTGNVAKQLLAKLNLTARLGD